MLMALSAATILWVGYLRMSLSAKADSADPLPARRFLEARISYYGRIAAHSHLIPVAPAQVPDRRVNTQNDEWILRIYILTEIRATVYFHKTLLSSLYHRKEIAPG
jgi:hypothetical protein